MKFMGSKNRIVNDILPIMLEERISDKQWWVEPFVGGGNIIDKVTGNRLGGDYDRNVINALKAIRDFPFNLPKNNLEFTEEDYKKLRYSDDYEYKSYAGFAFSYAGKWLAGWCRDKLGKRDYVAEAYRNAIKQSPKLKGVRLACKNYFDLKIPNNSLIYCDPPYLNTTKYNKSLDYNEFWDWCRIKYKQGHIIFISEYYAPKDFECIWEKKVVSSLTKDTGSKIGIEKLFTYKG